MNTNTIEQGSPSSIKLSYAVDERPSFVYLILFGIQWFAVGVPSVVIIGKIITALNHTGMLQSVLYLQKLTFVAGLVLLFQIFLGHRLPLFVGPSTVLVIAVMAGKGLGENASYCAMAVGGTLMAVTSMAGFFGKLQGLFRQRVVAVVLFLIAFTLLPSILHLVTGGAEGRAGTYNFVFALAFIFIMTFLQRKLRGVWQVTLLLWGLILGSIFYMLFFYGTLNIYPSDSPQIFGHPFHFLLKDFSFNASLMLSFIFSFIALSVNDMSSINSLRELLNIEDTGSRSTRGLAITGLGNILAGCLGVVGPVNFSMSPGVILTTRCASRYVLVPTAMLFILVSFSPAVMGLLAAVPPVIIGAILAYVLCGQIAAGLIVAFRGTGTFNFEDGLVIATPIMFSSLVSFLPQTVVDAFPALVRPIAGNGFVVGVISVMLLEHVVFKKKKE